MEKRTCFGTHEFSKICWICKSCENYEECKKEKREPNRAEI